MDRNISASKRHPPAPGFTSTSVTPAAISADDRLLPIDEVMDRLSMCRTTLYALIKAKEFPEPVRSGPVGRSSRWPLSDVTDYIARLTAARRVGVSPRPTKAAA